MSDTKHTPGPWEVKYGVSQSDFGFVVHEPTGGIVCGHVDYTMGDCVELHKANARLIAAAPELLEACKKAVHRDRLDQCGKPIHLELLAAIAKATT